MEHSVPIGSINLQWANMLFRLLGVLIIRSTRAGIRWGHGGIGIADYKRKSNDFATRVFRIIRARKGTSDDAHHDLSEEESLIGGQGKQE
ncbi:hypothetical protein F4803DRAFT_463715 [Xylaria telfairii]|nr:hypothetical protein F4803DRAFT_463715 [Xylaria telfairii]